MKTLRRSSNDDAFREFALKGNMWKVLIQVSFPLALYQSLSMLFKILDSMMASHISAESVSAVAYLSQINNMLSAVGGGLAIGSSLKISQAYGAGDYKSVKQLVNSLFAMCAILGLGVLGLILPFSTQLLCLVQTPENLIAIGRRYFIIELLGIVISFFNNVYIAVERSRGNTSRILCLNTVIILIKLGLTAVFVYIFQSGITMIAVATLISQLVLFVIGIHNMSQKDSAFSFSFHTVSFHSRIIGPMLHISFPVMIEKIAFSFGKVIVNSMSSTYGALTVGALGISNNINGVTTSAQNGFQDGCAAIISQNIGAKQPKRALEAFKKILVINTITGIFGLIFIMLFIEQLSFMFANSVSGLDYEFQQMIIRINFYDVLGGCIPLGINASIMALLFGFGYTRLTLVINFCRIFAFRIPVLWALQTYSTLGSESVGIVMLISNLLTALMSMVVGIIVIRKICSENRISFFRA